jgi:hypothetical protein
MPTSTSNAFRDEEYLLIIQINNKNNNKEQVVLAPFYPFGVSCLLA